MAVRIRMRRTGAKNKACYRIVVADARSQRDGRFIENLGFYDPRHNNEKIDIERADYWIACGAQPSETVADLIKRAKNPVKKTETKPKEKSAKHPEKVKPAKKAEKAEKTESTEKVEKVEAVEKAEVVEAAAPVVPAETAEKVEVVENAAKVEKVKTAEKTEKAKKVEDAEKKEEVNS